MTPTCYPAFQAQVVARSPVRMEVFEGVLEQECLALY
jgi:hypothetical protein